MSPLAPDQIEAVLARLDRWPRLGWAEPPVVQRVPELTGLYGLADLAVARDDLQAALHGGSKVRKLDYLFADPTVQSCSHITTMGAIGSGHLVATGAACVLLGKRLTAQLFWEPVSPGVLDNLGAIATTAETVRFHRSRVSLALTTPGVLLSKTWRDALVLPPGGTTPLGMIGHVRAGLQLAGQIARGEVERPDELWVSFGSGGTAIGLAAGLALAGQPIAVHAVLAVERLFAPPSRVRGLTEGLRRLLAQADITLPALSLRLDPSAIGAGYGVPSSDSLVQMRRWNEREISVEPVYTGKVLAALQARGGQARRVLFWHTARRPLPEPSDPNWQQRLPRALQKRLAGPNRQRRRLFALGAGAVAATALWRSLGYWHATPWRGQVLSEREAVILTAAAQALLPPAPLPESALQAIPQRIDAYAAHLPRRTQLELHALLLAVEQATVLGGHLSRFSRLAPAECRSLLAEVGQWGALGADVAGGLRDLVMLGYYQQDTTWQALGYPGPPMPAADRALDPVFRKLMAAADELPSGARRVG